MTEFVTLKFRRGTTQEWEATTNKLAIGEPGFDIQKGILKIGDGGSHWRDLEIFQPSKPPTDTSPIAIGYQAGNDNQGDNSIAIGSQAGQFSQGDSSVAIGPGAGQNNQHQSAIAVGIGAGNTGQDIGAIAIGFNAGLAGQGKTAVAIGADAGRFSQGDSSVAIGTEAGADNQGAGSVAIGYYAGVTGQADNTIILNASGNMVNGLPGQTGSFYVNPVRQASSLNTLYYNPTTYEITHDSGTIGINVGVTLQGGYAIAIGSGAGQTSQGTSAIAIGFQSGQTNQLENAVAIGYRAGLTGQNPTAIAIGTEAGQIGQGSSAIAIGTGAGQTDQADNTIILNASGNMVNGVPEQTGAFYVNPVRQATAQYPMSYNPDNSEITYSTSGLKISNAPGGTYGVLTVTANGSLQYISYGLDGSQLVNQLIAEPSINP